MYHVCFVCTGNICRSPMAEAVFRAQVRDAGLDGLVEVSSAGTGSWHLGDPADPRTAAVLDTAGYPLRHIARLFEPDWFDRHDLVVALDEGHAAELRAMARNTVEAAKVRLLRSYDPEADPDELSVPDPYYGGAAGFEVCLAMVEAAAPGLLSEVSAAVAAREAG
ncbi:low molecular weight protein-tyrosine-phosphatase [Streptomyces smyrnaeus]|uniref:low molecular weight protein-tyrosine-phosphatase n=1 Tax=Streptomyces TaxID=1883 RepID=UPI000C19BEBA|nr:low molecular weight protein-tyrosine-phosphatase [Streptomyces sp. RK75]MBQ0864364.1 low molecular weight phosphotyrosine protein phosphatase [Streptomyces sp. RK75]MBQ1160726.1 low molecular weight phosphotyrosine protein phosphatase [Streptomyces sp. A73]